MRLEALVAYRARMSAYGSGCVETATVSTQPGPKPDIAGAGRLAKNMPLLRALERSGNPNYLVEFTIRADPGFPSHATMFLRLARSRTAVEHQRQDGNVIGLFRLSREGLDRDHRVGCVTIGPPSGPISG